VSTSILSYPLPQVLIASIVLVTVLGWVVKPIRRALILIPFKVRQNVELHRLLTAAWLHADLTHLLFNMITLYFFAEPVMRGFGATRFLVLYFTAAPIAFIPTLIRYMRNPKYATLGASGAVSAVMFSAILLHPTRKLSLLFVPFAIPAIYFGLGYLAYSIWHSLSDRDNVNHDAHFAGALYGAIYTYLLEPEQVSRALHSIF
jgi:membrane associated rhomboid family serine protease